MTLKTESEGLPDSSTARRQTITRDTEIVPSVKITHGILRGAPPHSQHYPGWRDRQVGSAAAA